MCSEVVGLDNEGCVVLGRKVWFGSKNLRFSGGKKWFGSKNCVSGGKVWFGSFKERAFSGACCGVSSCCSAEYQYCAAKIQFSKLMIYLQMATALFSAGVNCKLVAQLVMT